MKKILIIGAGFLQAFVIKRATELGYHTITIDKNPDSIGFQYADEYGVVDIVDQKACLKYAQAKDIDGVMTAATDYGVLSAAYIAQEMNLPGINYDVAKIIKNKYMVRRTLHENKVDSVSQYYEVGNTSEILQVKKYIKYPIMVKPCDGSGSKAAKRVDSNIEFESACLEAMKFSIIGKAVIEDFIQGKEYGVESFVYNGEVYVLGIMDKYMTNPPNYAELGHSLIHNLSIEEKIKNVVKNAIKVLGINFGAVNMDLLVTGDKHICIVDIGARMGGNLIGSHIIPLGTGIDYMGNLIRASVGDSVNVKSNKLGVNIVTRILALNPGNILNLPDFERIKQQYKVDIYHHLKSGDTIREYHNNLDGCGYVVAIADNIKEAERRAEEVKQLIDNKISRRKITTEEQIYIEKTDVDVAVTL